MGARLTPLQRFSNHMALIFSEDPPSPPPAREALDGEATCCICMVNVPDTGFTQCHTEGFCADCVNRILEDRMPCPLCRAVVSAVPEDEGGYESEQYEGPVTRSRVEPEPRSEQSGWRSREEIDAILQLVNDLAAELGGARTDLSVR